MIGSTEEIDIKFSHPRIENTRLPPFAYGIMSLRWCIFFILFLPFSALAKPPNHHKNLAFKHILPDELESIEYVQDLAQDEQGFMWFGGRNGLARFDGYHLRYYLKDAEKPGSISSEQINTILLSRDGTLWFGTGDGLNRYNPDTDTFDVFKQKAESAYALRVNDIKDIEEWPDGSLWLATRGGLVRFYPQQIEFTPYFFEEYPPGKGDRSINALEVEGDALWIGQHTGGLSQFFPDSNTFKHYRHDESNPSSLSDEDVRSLALDSQGNIWIGTYRGGLNRLKPDRQTIVKYPYSNLSKTSDIWDVLEDKEKNIWVADGSGLMLWNPIRIPFNALPQPMKTPAAWQKRMPEPSFKIALETFGLDCFPPV